MVHREPRRDTVYIRVVSTQLWTQRYGYQHSRCLHRSVCMHHCVHMHVSVCQSVCTPKCTPLGRGGKDWFHKYRDWLTSVPIPRVTIVSSPKTEEEKKKEREEWKRIGFGSPGKKQVTCSINVQFHQISKTHSGLCTFWKDPFLFFCCQPRLREAVRYNYGWPRCPLMSCPDSRGAEGT